MFLLLSTAQERFAGSASPPPRKLRRSPANGCVRLRVGWLVFTAPLVWAPCFGQAQQIEPAPIISVRGERTQLAPEKPGGWSQGTRLHQLQTHGPGNGPPAHHAVVPGSIVVRQGDRTLVPGTDYLFDPVWGSLGVAPGSHIGPGLALTVDYRYSLRRLDSRIRTPEGKIVLRQGKPHLTVPLPPPLQPGELRLANLFVDYHGKGTDADEFPVQASAEEATTATTPGRIPNTLAKIRAGRPVHIVCWGDSVTAGGDASAPEARYPMVVERSLRAKFPEANIRVEIVAVGGSNSRQWLWPDRFPGRPGCDWQRVARAKPDLVTVEFVNDASMPPKMVDEVYAEIRNRLAALQAEVILITPHFVMPQWMGFESLREPDRRPYVLALRRFAETHGLALADASARWQHLWKEGLPYVTLLPNGINHPDDRGHALFAEELLKCFAQ